jgi:hypothetical protein
MSRARNVANLGDGIVTADITDGQVTAGKLASTLDLTGKTVTLPAGTAGSGNYQLIGETNMDGATQVAFDSIPSWATDILLVIDSPGYNANSETQIQLRSNGANIGSGYRSWMKNFGGGSFSTQGQFTGSHRVFTSGDTFDLSGQIRVVKVRDGASDYWTIQSIVMAVDNDTLGIGVGSLQTASTVNGIRIYSNNGTSTFDGGYARCYARGEA